MSDSVCQTGVCGKRISDAVCTTMFLDGAYTTVVVRYGCSTAIDRRRLYDIDSPMTVVDCL